MCVGIERLANDAKFLQTRLTELNSWAGNLHSLQTIGLQSGTNDRGDVTKIADRLNHCISTGNSSIKYQPIDIMSGFRLF
ncbi:unnamed protein product [Protopolystoma xenopodis]|uniref:Uncharacterized protein n=1 Tax=Protopolystoma xenopodis TaxID=117903 RepID=A0A448WIM0_9PLAT|nr:unnamed protein product [Protopolystoma xenopodis]